MARQTEMTGPGLVSLQEARAVDRPAIAAHNMLSAL